MSAAWLVGYHAYMGLLGDDASPWPSHGLGKKIKSQSNHYWLVVTGTFLIFPYIGSNHPNRLTFFRAFQTTSQIISWDFGVIVGWFKVHRPSQHNNHIMTILDIPDLARLGQICLNHCSMNRSQQPQPAFP